MFLDFQFLLQGEVFIGFHRTLLGLRPVDFYGSFVMNNTTDVELGAIDSEKVCLFYFECVF